MKKLKILFVLMFSIGLLGHLKGENFLSEGLWQILMKVDWKYKYNKEFEAEVPYPIFSKKIKALENKEIIISGFVVPVEMYGGKDGKFLILSAFPASSCFFCGGSGPESVMEVYVKNPEKHVPLYNRRVSYKGKLELNVGDFNHLIYILREAEYVPSN